MVRKIHNLSPTKLLSRWRRRRFDQVLRTLRGEVSPVLDGPILVDATWNNPNYWFRYSMLDSSLGFATLEKHSLVRSSGRRSAQPTLDILGIHMTHELIDSRDADELEQEKARDVIAPVREEEELLEIRLPFDIPGSFFYDFLLKRQRSAFVDLSGDDVEGWLAHYLSIIRQTADVLRWCQPSIVIASHAVGYTSPLVWISLQRKIEVIVPFGDSGQSRYWRLSKLEDIFDFEDCLSAEELHNLTASEKTSLFEAGKTELHWRLKGLSDNLGAVKAYRESIDAVSRAVMTKRFGWDTKKPIVTVYASNWFDYPHALGMTNFTNFFDWIQTTLDVASQNNQVNWLFKAHPCDEWYGGLKLTDLIDLGQYSHIALAETNWNGADVLRSVDAIVTFHGTIGIEATSYGKPVLVADTGWYHDLGIVRVPDDREHYMKLLRGRWWSEMDLKKNAETATVFAGAYWGRPPWQGRFWIPDDSLGDDLVTEIPRLVEEYREIIKREIAMVRIWYESGHSHYNSFKVLNAWN